MKASKCSVSRKEKIRERASVIRKRGKMREGRLRWLGNAGMARMGEEVVVKRAWIFEVRGRISRERQVTMEGCGKKGHGGKRTKTRR